MIQNLIDRYIAVSFKVTKKAESLIKEQIGNDLTNDQHYILRYIYQSKECTSSELADVFEVNKSAITAIINRMVDRELIKRTRDENDRRVVYLTLTDEGNTLFKKTEDRVHCLVKSIITKFNMEEIKNFIQTYEKLADKLIETKQDQVEE
ncbi:MarR family winged helix-turn-helix transcriptional regulator [Neobacillus sp. PS3-40]|uniref:MarR family winged helix-turn-helix transcriptional regulator n=1 Tax=Neobacillus sp. PS3-40 TaxID=3070679 RepID=UPI0035A93E69